MQSLFLDSNILLEGMRSRWGLSKAVLSLCAARIHQLVSARHVIKEVEGALLEVLGGEPVEEANDILADYFTFIDKARPVIVSLAATQEITAASRPRATDRGRPAGWPGVRLPAFWPTADNPPSAIHRGTVLAEHSLVNHAPVVLKRLS